MVSDTLKLNKTAHAPRSYQSRFKQRPKYLAKAGIRRTGNDPVREDQAHQLKPGGARAARARDQRHHGEDRGEEQRTPAAPDQKAEDHHEKGPDWRGHPHLRPLAAKDPPTDTGHRA